MLRAPQILPSLEGLPYYRKVIRTRGYNRLAYWPLWEGPASQPFLTLNGTTTQVNCGSGASLDDLPVIADLTVDVWVYVTSYSPGNSAVIQKSDNILTNGWALYISTNDWVVFRVNYDTTTNPGAKQEVGGLTGRWMHICGFWDLSEKKSRVAVDGVWGNLSSANVGAYVVDNAKNLGLSYGGIKFPGLLAWGRVSNSDRYNGAVGTNFTPPARSIIPTVDGNTVSLWPASEGYGTVMGDIGANNNDGAITAGDWGPYPAASNFRGDPARDGAYIGVALGWPGIGGNPCPFFDGVNSYVNVFGASFRDAFNGQELTVAGWAQVGKASTWSDGVMRQCIRLLVDANNCLYIRKTSTNDLFGFYYKGGGTATLGITTTLSTTSWFHWAMTVSKAADQMKAYINGKQVGTTQSGFGAWVGLLNASQCCIGAAITTPSEVWHGGLAHMPVWNVALEPNEIWELARE